MGVWRRFGCAEDRRLLVADTPVPWRDEGALPHPGLGFTRRFLVSLVFVGTSCIGQRPAAADQPFLDVFAAHFAFCHGAAAAVDPLGVAAPALVGGVVCEFVARGNATGPAFAFGIKA